MTKKKSSTANRKNTRGGTRSSTRSGGSRSSSSKSSSSRSKNTPNNNGGSRWNIDWPGKIIIGGMLLMGLSFVLILSLASPNQGQLTTAIANAMRYLFGWGSAVIPLALIGVGFYLVLWGMEQAPQLPRYRLMGLAGLFLVFEAFATLVMLAMDNGFSDARQVATAGLGGGYLGALLVWPLLTFLGQVGAVLVLMLVGLVAAVLLFGVTATELMQFGRRLVTRPGPTTPAEIPPAAERDIPINPGRERHVAPPRPTPDATAAPAATPPRPTSRRKKEPASPPAPPEPIFLAPDPGRGGPEPHWKLPVMTDLLEAGGDQEVNNAIIREQVEIIEHTLESFGAPAVVVEINQGPTVTQFGVEPQFLVQRSGKRTKVKVGKIASLADDLALALAAQSVRVQAPVPGKGYVGLEVPNPDKAVVSLRDVIESPEFRRIKSPLSLGLGQNVAGQPIATDLTKMPHLLIAGTTGSGKSVCVNSIIAGLLLHNTPDDLRLVMVDPKRVELTNYNGIPHLVAPVVVDMERVIGTLQWALREMDRRYKQLAETGVRNIVEFNKKMPGRGEKKMPYIVIFIDELADLMMMSPEDTERGITRLAQMARATGIHMVIATQRPSVDVVTGLIKANFPARIAFAVASSTDSRVILDTTGAERLLGQGDMLFQSPDAGAPVRLQGCYLSDRELTAIIEYWRTARRFNLVSAEHVAPAAQPPAPPTAPAATVPPPTNRLAPAGARPTPVPIPPTPTAEADPPPDTPPARPERVPTTASTLPPATQQPLWEDLIEEVKDSDQEDDLLPEAIALVRQLNKASTSLLQRRFRIGYTRAARLMDIMEEQGIIGPPTGTSKAREVLPPSPAGDGSAGII
ncbi:MAG: DNA translocase FtsK 4TM domain-containing protein [Ardenticatenaceae bacterium]|nr:DNA translocase FtsK 4TM domain-containing protein [Ardenticatenaceae bacterium]